MISAEDIEAFRDAEIADRILDRAAKGTTRGREIHANETLPFIRAYARMRTIAEDLMEFQREAVAASAASMKMYGEDGRPVE